ncbi:MAG: hypothetical protein PVJ51_14255, partial [Acidobacteriota bacterium]
ALVAGVLLSVAVHAVVLLLWRAPRADGSGTLAAGPRSGDEIAAAGGGFLTAVALRAIPERTEIPAPPKPLRTLEAPEVRPLETADSRITASLAPPGGGRPGPEMGVGLTTGTGRGSGGTDFEGRARNAPPEPRVIIPDWDVPRDVKGMRVEIHVLVDARGRALRVRLEPPTPSEDVNSRLVRDYLRTEYRPARREGRPVAGWAVLVRQF